MNRLGLFVRLVTVGLFAAVLFAGIAVALQMCVRLPRAHGAPLPPPPKLSAELLVGKWAYTWGGLDEGRIWFGADGSYSSTFGESPKVWHGTWEARDGWLELTEWSFCPNSQVTDGPVRHRIAMDTSRFPCVVGAAGATQITLRDPRR